MEKVSAKSWTVNSASNNISSGYQFYSFGSSASDLPYAGANFKSGAGGGFESASITPYGWLPRGTYLGISSGIPSVEENLVSFSTITSGKYRFFGASGTIRTELTKPAMAALAPSIRARLKRGNSNPVALNDMSSVDLFNEEVFSFPTTMKGVGDILSAAPAFDASPGKDKDKHNAVGLRRDLGEAFLIRFPLPGERQAFDYFESGKSGATQLGAQLDWKSYKLKDSYSWLFFRQDSCLTIGTDKVSEVYLHQWPELMTPSGSRPEDSELPGKNDTYDPTSPKSTQRIWFPDLVPQNRNNIQKNLRYGHKFNFERGFRVSLSSKYGWDVNLGPSYTYSNFYTADDKQIRTEKGPRPLQKTDSTDPSEEAGTDSRDWEGWSIHEPTEPVRIEPWDNIGLAVLRGMGRGMPGVSRIISSITNKDFWDSFGKTAEKEAEEEKTSQRQAEDTDSDHLAWEWGMAENILPAYDLTTDDWYPSAWKDNAAVEKIIGNTLTYRLGDYHDVYVSEDEEVSSEVKWEGTNITESEKFKRSESRTITNNVFEEERINSVLEHTLALKLTDFSQTFVSVTSSAGGIETEWNAFGLEVEMGQIDVDISQFAGVLEIDTEVSYANSDMLVSGAAKRVADARVNEFTTKADLVKNNISTALTQLNTEIGATRTENSALMNEINTKLTELEAKMAQLENTVTSNESRVSDLDSASLNPRVRGLFDGGGSALSNGRN